MRPHTRISRREPIGDGYDEATIVGPSPLGQSGAGSWPSSGGHSFVVSPVEFGDNTVMPADYITQHFDITPPPVRVVDPQQITPNYSEQPSPEAVFKAHAKANPVVKAEPVPLSKEEIAAKRAAAKAGKG